MFSGDMRRHRWKDSIRSETSFNWENCIEICFITTAFSHVILITFEWHKLGENSQVSGIESEFWCCMSVSFHAIFKPHLAILSLGYLGTARNNNDIVANDLYTVIVVFLLSHKSFKTVYDYPWHLILRIHFDTFCWPCSFNLLTSWRYFIKKH